MADPQYATGRDQAQRLRVLALAQRRDQYAIFQAYLAFGESPHGLVILDHLSATVLLQPCPTMLEEGKRQQVLELLRLIAVAPEMLEQLREDGDRG
jgi:hypothetical protein